MKTIVFLTGVLLLTIGCGSGNSGPTGRVSAESKTISVGEETVTGEKAGEGEIKTFQSESFSSCSDLIKSTYSELVVVKN